MNNILVTGANGQLAKEVERLSKTNTNQFFFVGQSELDIVNIGEVKDFVRNNSIDVIINCAAFTQVDDAEKNKTLTNLINYEAVKNLALLAKEENIKLIHVSSDYVFKGNHNQPYIEIDEDCTSQTYGKSKYLGDKAILEVNPSNSAIIRTSWMYSSFGKNFLKTILRISKEKNSINVVFDQVGTPTYAYDVAKTILDLIPQLNSEGTELYNYSNEGVCSWYDFAKEIVDLIHANCEVNPIESKDYPTLASRPSFSVLNKGKVKKRFGLSIPHWKDSLKECLKELGEIK